jgi:hypothetical protein
MSRREIKDDNRKTESKDSKSRAANPNNLRVQHTTKGSPQSDRIAKLYIRNTGLRIESEYHSQDAGLTTSTCNKLAAGLRTSRIETQDCESIESSISTVVLNTSEGRVLLSLTGLPNCIFETQDCESNRSSIHQPRQLASNEPTGLPITRRIKTRAGESIENSSSTVLDT